MQPNKLAASTQFCAQSNEAASERLELRSVAVARRLKKCFRQLLQTDPQIENNQIHAMKSATRVVEMRT